MDVVFEVLRAFADTLVNWNSRIALLYLSLTVLIVYVIWRVRGRPSDFVSFLLPRSVYLHKSNLVDIKIFVFNSLLAASGFLAILAVTPVVASSTVELLTDVLGGQRSDAAPTFALSLLTTLVIVLTSDFCTYWVHRVHHEAKALWPFHAVHHSAEVMTPLTVYRKHPVYDVISRMVRAGLLGIAQGVMLYAIVGQVNVLTIGAANAAYFLFNAFGSNLRHSHVWLSYGPVLERILISPAQHQVHHSSDLKHFNKNYGEVFAIWDWMFGTLYVPEKNEKLNFGISDENGVPVQQPHPTLRAALLQPFAESWQALTQGAQDEPARKSNKAAQ